MEKWPHILVVDDHSDSRELLEFVLRRAGFHVTVKDDAAGVLDLVTTTNFDALILDTLMPKITGIELCRKVRSFDQNTPIFFCSAAAHSSDKTAALSAGAQAYFVKPFDPYELTAALHAALNTPRA